MQNKWINKEYVISGNINKELINNILHRFWKDEMSKFSKDKYVLFLLRLEFESGRYVSLSHMQKVNNEDLDKVLKAFDKVSDIHSEDYTSLPAINVIISYKVISDEKLKVKKSKIVAPKKKEVFPETRIFGYNFPNSTEINKFGKVSDQVDNTYYVRKNNSNLNYEITILSDHNFIQVFKEEEKIITFKDYFSDDYGTFTRIVNNDKVFVYEKGEVILKKISKKVNTLNSISPSKKINNKIITLDIETYTIDGVMKPYCVGVYDGKNKKSYYLTDYADEERMIYYALIGIIKAKYHLYNVYVHNLSKFDGIYLLNVLKRIGDTNIKITRKDGKFINIKVIYNDKYTINFRDSLLILPVSLSKLAKSFELEDKGVFPYKFLDNKYNKDINLNYRGEMPDKIYFNISYEEYNKLSRLYPNTLNNWFSESDSWDLRKETIKYCELDCELLYQVLTKYNEYIFKYFKLNINKYPTLPSLAFAIFRANFLPEAQIPLLNEDLNIDIRQSYSGGSVDVYKPYGENIIGYDVNSLYPFVMKNMQMPVGIPTYFEGDITQFEDISNKLGFFQVEIQAPDNLKHPIIQTKVETKGGIRTVSPLGSWTDWIFSEEMNNAKTFGYKFKIKKGYLFDKANIFNNYIETLYEIKKASHKDEPMYLISKLLMNSLYGRFGMNQILEKSVIINDDEIDLLIDDHTITDQTQLSNNKSLVNLYHDNDKYNFNSDNINVAIASAISSYARIHMTKFKNNPEFNLYYSDTDSIYVDKPLHPVFVGAEIGELKLENSFKEAIFLAPKVYSGILDDNTEITKVKGL